MDDDVEIPEESEQLDQLQAGDTLVDRGVDDVLDEGYTAPEKWSAAQGYGNTATEMHDGETLEQRVAQEEPDIEVGELVPHWNAEHEDREVGSRRAGRLVDSNHGYPGEHHEAQQVAEEVGIDGGAAPAEEAAMHVIEVDGDEADEQEDQA